MVTQPTGDTALANLTGALGGIARDTLVSDLAALTILPTREEASPPAGVGIATEPPHAAAAPLGALTGDTEFMSGSLTFGSGGATLEARAWDIEMSESDLSSTSASGPIAAETPGNMEEMQIENGARNIPVPGLLYWTGEPSPLGAGGVVIVVPGQVYNAGVAGGEKTGQGEEEER